METIDFHGMTPMLVERKIDEMVGKYRLTSTTETVKFITGRAMHRKTSMKHLRMYGLNPMYEPGNDGAIIVVIE